MTWSIIKPVTSKYKPDALPLDHISQEIIEDMSVASSSADVELREKQTAFDVGYSWSDGRASGKGTARRNRMFKMHSASLFMWFYIFSGSRTGNGIGFFEDWYSICFIL
jgi:hypothetical protein